MLRLPLTIAFILAIAFGGGALSVVLALKATLNLGSITVGSWTAWPLIQTAEADPYTKARRARTGAILLGNAEGLVFVADEDSAGEPLVRHCHYAVTGDAPRARIWTLHAVRSDGAALDAGEVFPVALHSQNILKARGGAFIVSVSSTETPQPGNWLAIGRNATSFRLVLTLFDTPTTGSTQLPELQMPKIERLACRDG